MVNEPETKQKPGQTGQSAGPAPDSSAGTGSPSVTPKDVPPEAASARDVAERKTRSDNLEEREEALLDEAIELSFPASDPIAVPSYDEARRKRLPAADADQPPKAEK